MSETISFLSAELIEIGLMAAADPHFAERLIDALQRMPVEQETTGPANALVLDAPDR